MLEKKSKILKSSWFSKLLIQVRKDVQFESCRLLGFRWGAPSTGAYPGLEGQEIAFNFLQLDLVNYDWWRTDTEWINLFLRIASNKLIKYFDSSLSHLIEN